VLVRVALGVNVEQVEVPDAELFVFPRGIVGFEEYGRFALFQMAEPFLLLQSVDESNLGFVLIDPTLLVPGYRAKPADEDMAIIGMHGGDQPLLMSVVTVSDDGTPISANLRAPLAFNPTSKLGGQVILPESPYAVRFPLKLSADGTLKVAGQQSNGVRGDTQGKAPRTGSPPCSS